MAYKESSAELATILTQASDKLNQMNAQFGVEVLEPVTGTNPTTGVLVDGQPTDKIYTQEEAEKLTLEAVTAFKAELKAEYEDQQVAETSEETGFANLLQ